MTKNNEIPMSFLIEKQSLKDADGADELEMEIDETNELLYGVNDTPSWLSLIAMGFQQTMVAASGAIVLPLLIASFVCAEHNDAVKLKLIGTTLVMVGVATVLQTVLGVRLPLLQGPSFAFLPAIIAMVKLPEFQCPTSAGTLINGSDNGHDDLVWMPRLQAVQGGYIAASSVQMLLGMSGLVGVLVRYIGPLTVAPLMALLSITIVDKALEQMSLHWISLVSVAALLLFSLYLCNVSVPLPSVTFSPYSVKAKKQRIFGLFPYLLAIILVWTMCLILTYTFFGENDKAARTDLKVKILYSAPWFRLPYPGQWGMPIFKAGVIMGMVGGTVASVVESVGDYQACARVCRQPPPPSHAVNRGIFMEGFGCFLGSCFGGVAMTSFSQNIGVIGSTRVASRNVMVAAGCVFMVMGIFTKFGALLAMLPTPIVGSILCVASASVGGVGLSSIQMIDAAKSRNMSILGLAIMGGLMIPRYLHLHPITVGPPAFKDTINILFGIEMLVGGLIGFILDNTVPGATRAERGLVHEVHELTTNNRLQKSVYQLNDPISKRIRTNPILSRLPIIG
uniref:Solute carrier family 23 member 2 n=1 Tax=Plectus sambesii TaxID=2011161 RepID=A0A914WY57_9BILA